MLSSSVPCATGCAAPLNGCVQATPSGPCGACCGDDAAAMLPRFYFDIGATALRRSGIRDTGLSGRRTAAGVDFLTARDFELDTWNFGGKATFGGQVSPGILWEAGVQGFNSWTRSNNFAGGLLESSISGLPVAADTARSFGLTALGLGVQNLEYESQFATADMNVKLAWTLCPRQYFTLGLRFADIRDKLEMRETGLVGAPVTATGGDVSIRTRNTMLGPQLGYQSRSGSPWKRWGTDFSVKGALVWDFARTQANTNLIASPLGPRAFRTGDEKTETAGIFDLQWSGVYRLSEKMALRGGYQAIGIIGFGSALSQTLPSAFATNRSFNVNTGERAVYHGPFASLEWTWGGMR
jgi:hypothetical protein